MASHDQPTAIVTGASSGVGPHATHARTRRGWHVVMACRDLAKAQSAAQGLGIAAGSVSLMQIDLGSLASVRGFATAYQAGG
jgi:protochlorophyllide reductase